MTQSFEHSAGFAAIAEPIRNYSHRLRQILCSPREFFRHMSTTGGVSGPLTFALVTHWIATSIDHSWRGLIGEKALPLWARLLRFFNHSESSIDSLGRLPWFHHSRDVVIDWFWQAGPVVIDPFLTLGKLILMSLVIFIGARVAVPARSEMITKVTYESTLRVLCYAMAADLILAVPLVGSPLNWIFKCGLTVLGFFEVYRIGVARALVIALFPYLIMIGIISVGLLGSAALLIRLFIGS